MSRAAAHAVDPLDAVPTLPVGKSIARKPRIAGHEYATGANRSEIWQGKCELPGFPELKVTISAVK